MSLLELPYDIWSLIGELIHKKQFCVLRLTCKKLKRILSKVYWIRYTAVSRNLLGKMESKVGTNLTQEDSILNIQATAYLKLMNYSFEHLLNYDKMKWNKYINLFEIFTMTRAHIDPQRTPRDFITNIDLFFLKKSPLIHRLAEKLSHCICFFSRDVFFDCGSENIFRKRMCDRILQHPKITIWDFYEIVSYIY